MSQVHESYLTGIPSSGLTKARQNTRQAVRVDPTREATRGNPAIPVDRLSGTDTIPEVIGEYKQWQSDTAIRVQTTGIMHFESENTYDKANNGKGVVASGTAGLVDSAAKVGDGFGRQIGGYDEGGKHYLIVYKS